MTSEDRSASGKTYIAIDLKSYYASVECVDRGLDPLTTNLVVADESRTEKTICLAVTPSLKACGVSGRARLFEVIQRVKEVNKERYARAKSLGLLAADPGTGRYGFGGASSDAKMLAADPSLELSFIIAPPRMKMYEDISTQIYGIYLKYFSPDDIHIYSIDECFIDVTGYLKTYGKSVHDLTMTIIREVLKTTGITATAGIGSNMYLAKVAMDVVAKKVPADEDGVRIAQLDEQSYRELLWCHRPLTDFWRVGRGISKRLEKMGLYTMGDIARQSILNEDILYKEFGINAELLIDHAWGWEPTDIATIKSYRPETNSLSSGQVLSEPAGFERTKLIVREMTELLVLELVRKRLVTKQMVLTVGYDRSAIKCMHKGTGLGDSVFLVTATNERYKGTVTYDPYGRPVPKYAHGTGNIDRWTSSTRRIVDVMMELFDRIVDKDLPVRRINIGAVNIIPEKDIPPDEPVQMNLFTDYNALEKKNEAEKAIDDREKKIQLATLKLQAKFGKNAVLKGMNLQEGATTIRRNKQVGGHRAGED